MMSCFTKQAGVNENETIFFIAPIGSAIRNLTRLSWNIVDFIIPTLTRLEIGK